ncbi:MAG: outer membrane lipoprotein-sorting protein [Acidobacteria bacterium]|nr:outer membrane lipoprotein-sorting protein [Acidobacteriota bacterium]
MGLRDVPTYRFRRVFRLAPFVALVAACGLVAAAAPRPQPAAPVEGSADWVAARIDARDTGRDSRLAMTMRLVDRQGRARERTLVITSLAAAGPRGDRVLVRFLGPADIRGTGFLVWEHAQQEDERFLYLPALGRVRRIAGAEAQESFVGSDLSYEDIGGRKLTDYTYKMVETGATWTDAQGTAHPAWRIESTAKDAGARYPRTQSLVRKDAFVIVEALVFNRRGEREKQYTVSRLERPGGIWTVMDATMANDATKTRTTLVVSEARYNTGLTEAAFSRRELEQGAR